MLSLKKPAPAPCFCPKRVKVVKVSHTTSPVTVQVHFLEPLLYEDYKDLKTNEIAAMVKDRIQETIHENMGKK